MESLYATVRILNAAESFDREYTYSVLPKQRESVRAGSVCAVPYGNANKLRTAVVTSVSDRCEYPQIKPLAEILNYPVTLGEEMLGLCSFMKERCFCTYGAAAKTILPTGQGMDTETFYEAAEYDISSLNDKGGFICEYLIANGKTRESVLVSEFGEDVNLLLRSLTALGAVKSVTEARGKINEKSSVLYRISSSEEAMAVAENPALLKTEKQRAVVGFLKDGGVLTPSEAQELFGVGKAVLTSLAKGGYIEKFEKREERFYISPNDDACGAGEAHEEPPLSEAQSNAYSRISELMESGEPKACLLYGVTGSGKTRVIIEACRKAVAAGKSAIVLVPEIGLTAQAVSAFRKAFPNCLSVIHSLLSVGERLDTCRRLQSEASSVVIGTRSAIFAQVNNLGLIVIDEEQEHTYKSENTPRYHARDIARYRCAYNKCLMLLASATPSVESFYKAQTGIYTLVRLDERYGGAVLPECRAIDIRGDKRIENGLIVSEELKKNIRSVTESGGQAILFVNRRGYNTHLSCSKCGYVYTCPNCSVSLTYHAYGNDDRRNGIKKNRLICHYCGYVMNKPDSCAACGSEHLGFSGYGTQKLQEELEEDFPDLRCVRMDADTTSEKHSHEDIIASFSNGSYNLLFGTQMIAKGLDFPKVGLVGVVSADASLYMNDFRAGERTFSLFTQLAGRSGRGKKSGLALFQTANPENEVLKLSLTQNYDEFYKGEIALRKAVLFPPFCDIAVFTFSAETESDVYSASEAMSGLISRIFTEKYAQSGMPMVKLGPYREGIFRLRNKYRQRVIIKYKDKALSRRFLAECYTGINAGLPKTVKAELDINPPII